VSAAHSDNGRSCLNSDSTRRGAELNLPRLQRGRVDCVQGDVRNPEDLGCMAGVDLLIECSTEPSILAGYGSSPEYLLRTNLVGTPRAHRDALAPILGGG
jgi:hypothetical protein